MYICIYIYIYIYIYTDKPLQSAPQHSLTLLSFSFFANTGSRSSADVVGPMRGTPLAKR